MTDRDDKDPIPFIIRVQSSQSPAELDRIREFVKVYEIGTSIRQSLYVESDQPGFSDEEKEKWYAVFTDPAGITSHAFPDRDGMWRARVTCADGSQLYTRLHHSAAGVFTWLAESASLFRMFHRPYAEQDE